MNKRLGRSGWACLLVLAGAATALADDGFDSLRGEPLERAPVAGQSDEAGSSRSFLPSLPRLRIPPPSETFRALNNGAKNLFTATRNVLMPWRKDPDFSNNPTSRTISRDSNRRLISGTRLRSANGSLRQRDSH